MQVLRQAIPGTNATIPATFAFSQLCLYMYRPEEIKESDIGTRAGLFEVQKIGDEFYTFIVDCKEPKACTILLRGASKDVLNEVCPSAVQGRTFLESQVQKMAVDSVQYMLMHWARFWGLGCVLNGIVLGAGLALKHGCATFRLPIVLWVPQ